MTSPTTPSSHQPRRSRGGGAILGAAAGLALGTALSRSQVSLARPFSLSCTPTCSPSPTPSHPVERARVAEMEDEIRRLRMENEFLKRAAAFFAREQD